MPKRPHRDKQSVRLGAPKTARDLISARLPALAQRALSRPEESEYTRFERARILGARALQISLGAPLLVDVPPEFVDPVGLAEREFEAGVIPITVLRGISPRGH